MKKILYLSVFALALFSSCQNNPVIVDENKINMTNTWTPVYSVTSLHTYSGDAIGKNFSLGYGNFSNGTMVRIKVKYKSTYQKWCLPPSVYVIGCGSAYLRNNEYSTFDSIFQLTPYDSIREIAGFVKNGMLQFDTLIIMKGYPNFEQ